MKIILAESCDQKRLCALCKRPSFEANNNLRLQVSEIIKEVKKGGDKALRRLTKKFDGISDTELVVNNGEFLNAEKLLTPQFKKSLQVARDNIFRFHASQQNIEKAVQTTPGIVCWRENRPVGRVGLYIPGGSAPLPSTVLMLAVPAAIAGCKNITICSPPQKNGRVADSILYAAKLCGIKNVYNIGGAQAIAAMAYGTETIQKVDKIFGPGNQYVTVGKMLVSIDPSGPAIDMPAGPSEVMVIADNFANVKYVASDLLSQAEHGIDSQVVLVAKSEQFVRKVLGEMEKQLRQLPRREIAQKSLEKSFSLVVGSAREAIDFANLYAPEHLILNIKNYSKYLGQVQNAGSVFLGPYSAESIGDYASGTNHSLPTGGFAKSYSGVSCDSFIKKISFQRVSKKGLQGISDVVREIASYEGLRGHSRAVEIRQ